MGAGAARGAEGGGAVMTGGASSTTGGGSIAGGGGSCRGALGSGAGAETGADLSMTSEARGDEAAIGDEHGVGRGLADLHVGARAGGARRSTALDHGGSNALLGGLGCGLLLEMALHALDGVGPDDAHVVAHVGDPNRLEQGHQGLVLDAPSRAIS